MLSSLCVAQRDRKELQLQRNLQIKANCLKGYRFDHRSGKCKKIFRRI